MENEMDVASKLEFHVLYYYWPWAQGAVLARPKFPKKGIWARLHRPVYHCNPFFGENLYKIKSHNNLSSQSYTQWYCTSTNCLPKYQAYTNTPGKSTTCTKNIVCVLLLHWVSCAFEQSEFHIWFQSFFTSYYTTAFFVYLQTVRNAWCWQKLKM